MTDVQSNWALVDFLGFEKSLNGGSKAPFHAVRKRAFENFMRLGFPTPKIEEWKYTDISSLKEAPFALALSDGKYSKPKSIEKLSTIDIILRDGKPISIPESLPGGVNVESLRSALKGPNAQKIEEIISASVSNTTSESGHEAFLSLNTAFIDDGVVIIARENTHVSELFRIVSLTSEGSESTICHPRIVVIAESGASITILENYSGSDKKRYCRNSVVNFQLGQASHVDHYRIQEEGLSSFHFSLIRAELARAANFRTHTFTFGGKLARNQVDVALKGEGCNVTMNGLTVINGEQHVDNQTLLDNEVAHCESLELYKGVYAEKSEGVFSGTIIVRPDAQKTNAIQSNRSLLLSKDAVVNTKPQLKIWADDVKCTHGATVGQLDEEALFYLRSRGISEKTAKDMLIVAFAGEIISQVRIEALQVHLEELLHRKLWNS